jgi:hypothetical protein
VVATAGYISHRAAPGWLAPLGASVLLGAAFGAFSGVVYWLTIGRTRSFTSIQALGATTYELLATGGIADDARRAI